MSGYPNTRRLHLESLESRYALDGDPALLLNGQEVRREVGQEDPFDEFFFDAQANELVWVSVGEERAKSNNAVRLTIDPPSGNAFSDSGANNAFLLFQASSTGRYRVFVSEDGNDQDFDYVIRKVGLPRPLDFTYAIDAFMERGERHVASLGLGQLSVVQFNATEGTTAIATIGETSKQDANPIVWVVSPSGSFVDLNGGLNGVSLTSEIGIEADFFVPETGIYTAIIGDSYGDEPLSYSFSLATLPGEVDYDLPQNTLLASGERHTSSVRVGEQHIVQFYADAGVNVIATLGETTTEDAEPKLRVLDPLGVQIDLNSGLTGTSLQANTGLEAFIGTTTSGLYTAIISDDGNNDALDYTFSLWTTPGAIDYTLEQNAFLESGERRTGTVGVGEQHIVQFYADAGVNIFATLGETTTLDSRPRLRVIDPNGLRVDLNGGLTGTSLQANTGLEAFIGTTTSGLYTAIISDDGNNDILDYSFRVAVMPSSPSASDSFLEAVLPGSTLHGTLPPGEFVVYPFFATAGERVELRIEEEVDTSASIRLQVFERNGQRLQNTTNTVTSTFAVTPSQSGLYYAILSESGANEQLAYSVSATGVSSPPATLAGDYDGNWIVDSLDYIFWKSSYGSTIGHGLFADGNGDGRTDTADYTVWRDRFDHAEESSAPSTAPQSQTDAAASVLPSTSTKGLGDAAEVSMLVVPHSQRAAEKFASQAAPTIANPTLKSEAALLLYLELVELDGEQQGSIDLTTQEVDATEESDLGLALADIGNEKIHLEW